MQKIIIFDWGGVILKEFPNHYCDRDAVIDTVKKFNSDLSNEEAYNVYLKTLRDENGRIIITLNDADDKYNWYERIKDRGNLNAEYDEFVNEFTENYKKIDKYEEVVNYIYSLKNRAKLYLFSDLIFTCYESLQKQIDLNIFEDVFLSFEEGYEKLDINAFLNVNNKINYPDENKEILFIDNTKINIENAKKVGWNTCLATGDEMNKIVTTINNFLND